LFFIGEEIGGERSYLCSRKPISCTDSFNKEKNLAKIERKKILGIRSIVINYIVDDDGKKSINNVYFIGTESKRYIS